MEDLGYKIMIFIIIAMFILYISSPFILKNMREEIKKSPIINKYEEDAWTGKKFYIVYENGTLEVTANEYFKSEVK